MYGDFPAQNSVYTPYIPINVWFWPTLQMTVQLGHTWGAALATVIITNPFRKHTYTHTATHTRPHTHGHTHTHTATHTHTHTHTQTHTHTHAHIHTHTHT